jgi:hypothetical protein
MIEPRYLRLLREWMSSGGPDMRHSKEARYITPADAHDVLTYVDDLQKHIDADALVHQLNYDERYK